MARVWRGQFGDYIIPERFDAVKFAKDGWFDNRRTIGYYAEFIDWLKSIGEPCEWPT